MRGAPAPCAGLVSHSAGEIHPPAAGGKRSGARSPAASARGGVGVPGPLGVLHVGRDVVDACFIEDTIITDR